MLRLLVFLLALFAATAGLHWIADQSGGVTAIWDGRTYIATPLEVFGVAAALSVLAIAVYGGLRFVFGAPSRLARANRARRREKGLAALTRGLVAVGAGDIREAQRCAREAERLVGDESLTKLLRAQTAQASGDRAAAASAFNDMLAKDETRVLGLRGLHLEARRAGEGEAALTYARRAYERNAPPWAAQAVLDDYAQRGDWANALATVEANTASLDAPTATRWRAVLLTALAQQKADREPARAMALAKEALDLAPTLIPAAALLGRLTAASGDLKKAARWLEGAYRTSPHPDLAQVYVRLRPGDSAADRLARAQNLARVAPSDPESLLMVARAALEAQDLDVARTTLAPLLASGRPTARTCLAMAEIEDAAGDSGGVREWLARTARAPRDRAWVADGVIADSWAPVGPKGVLDAFVWRAPEERLTDPPPLDLAPAPAPPPLPSPPPPVALARTAPPRPAPGARAPSQMPGNAPDDPGPERRKAGEFRDTVMD